MSRRGDGMSRDEHAAAARLATVEVMVAESHLESERKKLEGLMLTPGAHNGIIDQSREVLHVKLDVMIDALGRQKHHMMMAMTSDH